jgi:hypothetical protein
MTTKKSKKLHPVNVRLDDQTLKELHAVAAEENRSLSNLVFTVLRDWLDKRRGAKP